MVNSAINIPVKREARVAVASRTVDKLKEQGDKSKLHEELEHIDRHLDDDLDLDALSSVAAYSKYHFHRQFTATFGLVRASLYPARPHEARFIPASLQGCPKRHGHGG